MGCRLRAAPFFRHPRGGGGEGVHPETLNETHTTHQRAPWMIAREAGHLIAIAT
jgi:hypothetical protein